MNNTYKAYMVHDGDKERIFIQAPQRTKDTTESIMRELEKAVSMAEAYNADLLQKSHLRDAPQPYTPEAPALSQDDIDSRILKAVRDGAIEASYITRVHYNPQHLNSIPIHIAKKYDLPRMSESGLLKSLGADDVVKSHDDIAEALLCAVKDHKLEPQILGAFATHPERTLALIPEDITKSYGLPKPARRAPRTEEFPSWMNYGQQLAWRMNR